MRRSEPDGSWWTLDLLVVLAATGAGALVVASDLQMTPLRILLAGPLVLLLPGYAAVSLLFPESAAGRNVPATRRLGLLERVLLGVVVSVAVVPLAAFGLNFTPVGVAVRPLLAVVVAVTVVATLGAAVRRLRVPAEYRFAPPPVAVGEFGRYFRVQPRSLQSRLPFEPQSTGQLLLNGVLVASLLVFVASVGYAAVSPPPGDRFTELYLLTENDEGELVADDYPDTLEEAAGEPIHVAVSNQEGVPTDYTVVVQVQAVERDDGTVSVTDASETDRIDLEADPGETEVAAYELDDAGSSPGDGRLAFLLYRDEPPSEPTGENAYRTVFLDFSE